MSQMKLKEDGRMRSRASVPGETWLPDIRGMARRIDPPFPPIRLLHLKEQAQSFVRDFGWVMLGL